MTSPPFVWSRVSCLSCGKKIRNKRGAVYCHPGRILCGSCYSLFVKIQKGNGEYTHIIAGYTHLAPMPTGVDTKDQDSQQCAISQLAANLAVSEALLTAQIIPLCNVCGSIRVLLDSTGVCSTCSSETTITSSMGDD